MSTVIPFEPPKRIGTSPTGPVQWLEVRGDKMAPTVRAGDFVAVDTADTSSLGQGGVFALYDKRHEDILVIRVQLVLSSDRGLLRLVSDNPLYPEDRELLSAFDVIGRVFARVTRV